MTKPDKMLNRNLLTRLIVKADIRVQTRPLRSINADDRHARIAQLRHFISHRVKRAKNHRIRIATHRHGTEESATLFPCCNRKNGNIVAGRLQNAVQTRIHRNVKPIGDRAWQQKRDTE